MNIIVGNCAGTFSGFLSFLSWMKVAEDPSNDINLFLHARNKTAWPGSSYSNYRWIHSSQFSDIGGLLSTNILHKFFKENENLKKNFSIGEFDYVENYPIEFKHRIINYPTCFKYDARGSHKEQYSEIESLTVTRNALKSQWDKFEFTDYFNGKVKEEEKLIEGKKVVCIMLRSSTHYQDQTFRSQVVEHSIECVRKVMDDYDSVLITCQIQPFVDAFVKEFGDRCIFTNRERHKTDHDWPGADPTHFQVRPEPNMPDSQYEIEYEECLLDVLLSSKTNMILGASSNMFLGALSMNPNVEYDVFINSDGY